MSIFNLSIMQMNLQSLPNQSYTAGRLIQIDIIFHIHHLSKDSLHGIYLSQKLIRVFLQKSNKRSCEKRLYLEVTQSRCQAERDSFYLGLNESPADCY